MKKALRFFVILLGVILVTSCFTACGSDDDNEKNSSIVGTWVCENPWSDATIQFYSNGTFYWCETDSHGLLDEEYGKYQLEGDIILIRWDSDGKDELPMRWKLQSDNGILRIIAQDSIWVKK